MEILDNIPFSINSEDVVKELRFRQKNPSIEKTAQELLEATKPIAKPKALYKVSYINGKNEDSVDIDGLIFTSRILRMNLENAERVFPYVVTAGRELEEIEISKEDIMRVFCLDTIKEMILERAIRYFENYLKEIYALGKMSHMSPGSLHNWPVSQQRHLFSIFGNVEELIGVKLTKSFMMGPVKSVSGIFFPTEIDFKSCMLCTREKCIKRRARYDPEMAEKYRVSRKK